MISIEVHVYRPDQQIGWGPRIWREMVSELVGSRELIWRLLVRDFMARYKQTVLGIGWALIMPLVAVGTFVFLNRSGILNVGDIDIPYPAYALLGLTIWQLFSSGLVACSNAIVSGGSMVVKIYFPKECLVIASLGQVMFETLVRIGLLVLVFAVFRVTPRWTAIFFPVAILPLLMLTLGLGLLLSLLNAILRDIGNMVSLLTTFLLFLTPVVYPVPSEGTFATFSAYNPLAALVTGARDVVVTGYLTEPIRYGWASVLSLAVFLISWRLFHMAETRMAERV